MGEDNNIAIRKYSAIYKANRTMFGAVAIASAIIGASVVGLGFIYQDIAFKARVISEQDKTLSNIETSRKNITELTKKLEGLKSNDNLKEVAVDDNKNPLRPILDALPAKANATAIGSSLNQVILAVPGIKIEPIRVDPAIEDTSTASGSQQSSDSSNSTDPNAISSKVKTIGFSFSVTANAQVDVNSQPGETQAEKEENARKEKVKQNIEAITKVLQNMEKSIRTFRVISYKAEGGDDSSLSLKISAVAYYLPEYKLGLTSKTISLDESATKKSTTNKTGGAK